MDRLVALFQNFNIDYRFFSILMAVAAFFWGYAFYEIIRWLLEVFDIKIYEIRRQYFSKAGEIDFRKLPKAPELGGAMDITFFVLVLGIILGVVSAVLAADPMVSPVLLVCFPVLGYSFFRSRSTGANIEKRIQFTRLLRIFINDLKAFQSAQIAADNLNKHYKKLLTKQKDAAFERDLQTLIDQVNQGAKIDEVADSLFSGDEVYKSFSDVIGVTTRTGIAAGIDYANEKIRNTSDWKKLVNLMGSSMSAIKFAAIVLEILLVLGIFIAVLPFGAGGVENLIHNYFFANTANKLFFIAIMLGHTIVEFGFMEFIKINNESV